MFKVNIRHTENEVVVAPQGELDAIATTEMDDFLTRVTRLARNRLVLDCQKLEYISSSGLRFFLLLKKNSEQKGGSAIVRNMNKNVEDIFRLCGFHHIFDIE